MTEELKCPYGLEFGSDFGWFCDCEECEENHFGTEDHFGTYVLCEKKSDEEE